MNWFNILKAKKKVEKDLNPYNWIQEPMRKLKQEAEGKSGSALGISPQNSTSLLAMAFNHGRTPGAKSSVAGKTAIQRAFEIGLRGGDIDKAGAKRVLQTSRYLKRMETSEDSNPQNLKATHPAKTVKTTKGRAKSKEKKEMYGHYYNSHYNKIQSELGKKTLPAIPKDWASENRDTAKPPLWQFFFSGGERGVSSKQVVTKGLLTILEEYEAHLKKENLL